MNAHPQTCIVQGSVKIAVGVVLGRAVLLPADVSVRVSGPPDPVGISRRIPLDSAVPHGDKIGQKQNAAKNVSALPVGL